MPKSSAYQLKIDQPCHENWDEMSFHEKGRFCDRCAKPVNDFTLFSDKELALYFKNKPTNVCGRFKPEQLDKTYAPPRQLPLPFPKRIFRFLLSLFSAGLGAETLKAQTDSLHPLVPDTSMQLIARDTLLVDSTVVTKSDSLPASDSLTWEVKIDTSFHVPIQIINIEVITVSGGVGYNPPVEEGPTFIDLCKQKAKNIIFPRAETEVKKTNPVPPAKQPEPKDDNSMIAVLPEEIRRKGIPKA